jgi:hypothetical protein
MTEMQSYFQLGKSIKPRHGKVNEHNGCIPRDFWLEGSVKSSMKEMAELGELLGYLGTK